MKIKGLLITGIILTILGIGISVAAGTQINFDEGYVGLFTDPTLEEKEQTFGTIHRISYDGDDENLEILYSEGVNTFTYYENESLTYQIHYDEEKKELSIEQKHSFSFINFSFGKKATLTINSDLEEVEIDAAAGNIDIKNLTIHTAKLDVNAGNLKIDNSNITTLDIESDAGNVNLKALSVDTGKIEVKAGNLKVEESNFINTTIHAAAGNVNLIDSTFEMLEAKLNAGNFTLNGDILTHADIKLDAGNLKMTLRRGEGSYCVNGVGEIGTTTILYNVSAGNKKIYYAD